MVTVKDKVRFVETDMMGVVHHSNFFRWFEMGRVEYLRQAGVYLLELMAAGILFPISDVSCKYRASARFDDCIAIEASLVALSKVKMVRLSGAAGIRRRAAGHWKYSERVYRCKRQNYSAARPLLRQSAGAFLAGYGGCKAALSRGRIEWLAPTNNIHQEVAPWRTMRQSVFLTPELAD